MKLSNPIVGCMRWGQWGNKFTTDMYADYINRCIALGLTSFDHADIYGDYTTEAEFGKALHLSSAIRSKIQLITKCGIKMKSPNRPLHLIKSYDASKAHIVSSVEQSLKNFHTDYIDVLLIHRPDFLMIPEQIASAVQQLKQSGKILSFGVSNFLPHQLELLRKHVDIAFNQIQISPYYLDHFFNGTIDYCYQHQIKMMAWGVFASERNHQQLNQIHLTLQLLAERYNTSITSIIASFIYKHPAQIIPIIGSTNWARIQATQEAKRINLSNEDWYNILSTGMGKEVD